MTWMNRPMPRKQRVSLLLLAVYAVALVLPQGAELERQVSGDCVWSESACNDSILLQRSQAVAPALSGKTLRVLAASGRASGSPLEQFRYGGVPALFLSRHEGDNARALVSARKYHDVLQSIHRAESGLPAAPPRAPPVPV